MAPFPELLKVARLAVMPPAKVKHRKPHQATVFVRLLYLGRVLLSRHWLLLVGSAGAFAEAVTRSVEGIQWGCAWIWLVSRLPQRSFVYLVSVYVLDPNLQPVAPPLIRFENGVLGIVGNYFGGLFSALSFDFPSHMSSPMEAMRSLLARKSTQQ
ncbi:MAG: hypothetical protein WAK55_07015 [Xanthobacteraceae bacterium]